MSASMEGSCETPVLEPLSLKIGENYKNQESEENTDINQETVSKDRHFCPCLLCSKCFNIESKPDDLLAHLIMIHKFVIADVNLISNLKKYIIYWKERLRNQSLSDFCSKIVTNTAPEDKGEKEEFYMLCDVLPEDKELRQFLQKEKLEEILSQKQKERNDEGFSRTCLFCSQLFDTNRAVLFNHMAEDHAFNVGRPDNLVFTDEFLDKLQEKLLNLQCLYCEKTFKDRSTLKEHMRKKQHRKINPKNKTYDKYYIINYQELGKNWESIQSEDSSLCSDTDDTTEVEEDDWSDWTEEAGSQAVCLFCEFSSSHSDRLHSHMQELHDFNLHELKIKMNLTFYQKIKLINFIRRKTHLCVCYACDQTMEDRKSLQNHLQESDHINKIPAVSVWDQPQYYFPTYENDNLLCQLDDDDEDDGDSDNCDDVTGSIGVSILAEDTKITDTILFDKKLRQELMS